MVAGMNAKSLRQYGSAMKTYLKFCKTRGLIRMSPSSIENFLTSLWDRGIKKGTPATFRSAIRKICNIYNYRDPFEIERLNMFVNAFTVDREKLEVRFIEPSHFDDLKGLFRTFTDKKDKQAALLLLITVAQNVRMRTLTSMTYNDLMPESGTIWIAHAKKHSEPFLTIAHPETELLWVELFELMGRPSPNTKITQGWTETNLNAWLQACASSLGWQYVPTWHWLRHTATQRYNDLSYPNAILRVLGTWKRDSSMKTYIRCRTPWPYPAETKARHKAYIETLTARLRQHRGKMVWLVVPKAKVPTSRPPALF
jgi:site-specific recombinase XerD